MNSALVALFFNILFLVTRWEARASQKEEAFEIGTAPTTVNVVTGAYHTGEEPEGIVTEYYDSGKYAGRIKRQLAYTEDQADLVTISRFIYRETSTEVVLLKCKLVYRFDDNQEIHSVESFDVNSTPQYFCWENACLKKIDPPEEDYDAKEFWREQVGETFLVMAGYYDHPLEAGVQGHGEVSDRVRVTYINGILNLSPHCILTAKFISDLHGGVNVHYIYRPTEGWSADLFNSAYAKFGYLSPQAYLLAARWKELIAEMGGPEKSGTIIHYAHSVGASDTWNARKLMTAEEKKMIRVITVGSPFMIRKDGFHSVVNYVSVRDGVSLLDPLGYIRGMYAPEDNDIKFVGTFWGMPIVDHLMEGDAYREVIQGIGKEFISTYGSLK